MLQGKKYFFHPQNWQAVLCTEVKMLAFNVAKKDVLFDRWWNFNKRQSVNSVAALHSFTRYEVFCSVSPVFDCSKRNSVTFI